VDDEIYTSYLGKSRRKKHNKNNQEQPVMYRKFTYLTKVLPLYKCHGNKRRTRISLMVIEHKSQGWAS